ncbi:GlxA family transcriptional regulator [Flavihumibacter petaseus]|uniref:Putative AraC family transcriptional regulator n=1 Tax=Flavihumibacter petaseus NBRC 106054 TaxID=1220578 RepID=A0A0E9MU05_9BACT|nr:helix-turn-helix domain-containing protein [Flavihumibacter petaseus]GAO41049.1 putative AraC family transcriptional regulator [Flavihumibacter petaseus NBRC 106054]
MKKISILVPEDAVLASIDDPRMMFAGVNEFLLASGREPMFQIELVGMTSSVALHGGRFTVHTDRLLHEVERTDLIFIPALIGDMQEALQKNAQMLPWLREQYAKGAELVSLCIGAFLLASTGLLNGKKCSTHWRSANDFRIMFPEIDLVDDTIITEEQGLYTSGGANSYWNLLVYLVEKMAGRPMAITAAKVYAIEIERKSQSPFIMFNGQKGHSDEPVRLAQEFIEKNVGDKISVEELATRFAIGRRNFERRFKKATNNTPIEYIQRVKIEAAKKGLENGRKNVSEVMYEVGYADTKSFRSIFKKITGLSPADYRNKYNKEAIL